MDITVLVSLLAFFVMVASWVMLPTTQETAKTASSTATQPAPGTSKA
jgi:hypothetical protein